MQLRLLTDLQKELRFSYCKLAVVSVDTPEVSDAFRVGLGANFQFLSDTNYAAINELDIVDISDKKHGTISIPYAFLLLPDLTVYKIYCGWWYVGRPTIEDLRHDYREMMKQCRNDFNPQA